MLGGLEPGALVASIVVSTLGLAMFIYGKKQKRLPALIGGLALMGSAFVPSAWLMLGIAACVVGLVASAKRFGI